PQHEFTAEPGLKGEVWVCVQHRIRLPSLHRYRIYRYLLCHGRRDLQKGKKDRIEGNKKIKRTETGEHAASYGQRTGDRADGHGGGKLCLPYVGVWQEPFGQGTD